MTTEVLPAPRATSTVEAVLMGILEREWEGQSGCAGPLAITAPVRDAIELVFAGAPGGVFALAPAIHDPADSPQALIDRLRDRLPAEIPAWNMRALGRVECLRASAPLLPAPSATPGALPAPAPAAGALPAVSASPKTNTPADASQANPESRRTPAVVAVAVGGAIAGVVCGLVAATLAISIVLVAALVGALGAILGASVGFRAQAGRRR